MSACDFLKGGPMHWLVCDEDIVFFNTVANLYKLPRPMLFPTTSMILVSTKKIKIYFFFFFFTSNEKQVYVFGFHKQK